MTPLRKIAATCCGAGLFILGVLAVFVGPVPGSAEAAGDLDRIRKEGKLVMLAVPHQESAFVKTNLAAGPMKAVGTAEDFDGVDVELMAAFAERLGVSLEIRPATGPDGLPGYRHLIPSLEAGKGDVIASSFSVTEERGRLIDYSEPYFTIYPAVVALAESTWSCPEDLARLRPSTVAGSSQEGHLLDFGFEREEILYLDFQFENYAAVLEGDADFTVQDSSSAERVVRQYPELKVACALSATREPYAFGVRKGSDLKGELDGFILDLRKSGRLEQILQAAQLSLAE